MGSPPGLLLQHQQSDSAVSKTVTYHHLDQLEQHDLHEVACRLEVHLKALEHECKKIDAFKRELPFCMQLLHDAIEASKEQLAVCCALSHKQPQGLVSRSFGNRDPNIQSASERSVLEEFASLKKQTDSFYTDSSEGVPVEKRISTHANGDTFNSLKIWNPRAEVSSHNQERCQSVILSEERSPRYMQEQTFSSSSKPVFHSKQKSGGAFLPFSRDKRLVQPTPRPGAVNPTDLAIVCCDSENIPSPAFGNPGTTFDPPRAKSRGSVQQQARETLLRELPTRAKSRDSVKQQPKETLVEENKAKMDSSNVSQPARKARRSWSPELHRRFVDALQNLGGAQATPKQIRELMNIEGLTNDEVKSHLQKYRLHTRRLGPYPTPSPHASPVVFPRGLQVPSEHAVHAAVQQAPASFNFARQPESCQTSLSQEIVTQLDSSGRLPSRSSLCCGKQSPVAHSQSSWKGPLQLIGHSSAGIYGSGDAGGEESVGEAVKSEDSGWKGQHPGLRLNEVDESEDQSVSGSQSRCIGEDETEHDDSEGLESCETTSLKL